ncbi:hypothetical protein [Hyunsoonleella aestuarii]|uniref:HipA N-terminal subdomain 1 domain-containing protein n=1 Tax=Hyunsoonleella aestuarii TaxID=912802 RepID=A0ABP8EC37_9FLAO|nr:hypothetical protein [Hyunsoonleella aestuarii]
MNERPLQVNFAGKEGDFYLIKFPNLKIPVSVNENLFQKMKHSKEYTFNNLKEYTHDVNSA